jgi:peptidoglycan/LPS O-acetylase OafA/YrhL
MQSQAEPLNSFPRVDFPRFDAIDLLRGLSILAVILLHASIFLRGAGHPVGTSFPHWLRFIIFNNGGNGVSAFFAISGFLITFISIRRFGSLSRMDPLRFYRIRFARIAPPLLLLLSILSVLHLAAVNYFHIKPAVGTLPQALFAALTFQVNWFEAVHGWLPPVWTVLWTLSVEEMFYLFFPLLCVGLLRKRWSRPVFFVVLFGLVLFGPFARTHWYTTNEMWSYQSYWGNVDNIALGCLTALLADRLCRNSRFVQSIWPLVLEWTGAALMLLVVCEWPRVIFRQLGHSETDVTVLGVGTCLVMLGSVLRNRPGLAWAAPMRWLGRHSYEAYLTHEFAVIILVSVYLRVRQGPVAVWILVIVIASALLGYALARLVAEPANRALRNWRRLPAQRTVEHIGS